MTNSHGIPFEPYAQQLAQDFDIKALKEIKEALDVRIDMIAKETKRLEPNGAALWRDFVTFRDLSRSLGAFINTVQAEVK